MRVLASLLALALGLTGCGGSSDTGSSDGSEGAELFAAPVLGGQAGCVTCHSLEPDRMIVGPSLDGLGDRAGSRVAGMSADEYIRTSIVDPDAFVVDGFDDGRMPGNWAEVLSDAEIDALVDYLGGL